MQFNPTNNIIQLCLKGMAMEENGKQEEAGNLYQQAFDESTNDFEKFIAAYYLGKHAPIISDKLKWFEMSLQFACNINDENVKSAYPTLYLNIANCYELLYMPGKAKENFDLAALHKDNISDEGPFYHGTKADLQVGDFLKAGGISNYQSELTMNHIYFTALIHGAGLAAALAKGNGRERVYIVAPTGNFDNDPNVTDKKFPGNLTRSYRSEFPLKIIGEIEDWAKQSPQDVINWKKKLENNKGKIIN